MKYKPRKGFYNLSEKPKTLSKREHEKVQRLQMGLMNVGERKNTFIRDKENWRVAQEMSGKLQQIILQHYVRRVIE